MVLWAGSAAAKRDGRLDAGRAPRDTERKETAMVVATGDWLAASQRETTRVLAEMTWPQLFQVQKQELNGK
jgi:hypothetical protein